MIRILLAGTTALLCLAAAPARAELTLEGIMADPDWIGSAVEAPFWSADGSAVYYRLKRKGSPLRDAHRVALGDGKDSVLSPVEMADADAGAGVYDNARHRAAFVRNGDVFVRDLASHRLQQITRSDAEESAPQFCADDRCLQFRVGNDWFVHDFASGVTAPAATVKLEKNPEDKKSSDFEDLQLRLISTLKKDHDDKLAQKKQAEELRAADSTRAPKAFYIGDDVVVADSALSPDGRHLLVVATPKGFDAGREGKMPKYVTESGYEEVEDTHTRVGRGSLAPHTLWLLDIGKHETMKLAYDGLPGIHDDPLASVRAENAKAKADREKAEGNADKSTNKNDKSKDKDKKDAKPEAKERPLQVANIAWTHDGAHAAVQLRSLDNKDRWIATLDGDATKLAVQHRLTDAAWINWNFNEFGWLPDNRTLWYVSEESGYAQLYSKQGGDKAKALTSGQFEVSAPSVSADGKWIYVRANVEAPYVYDIYRVASTGGKLERLTSLKGAENFSLSPDNQQLLVSHSSSYVPVQLAVVPAAGGQAREITDTLTPEYKARSWLPPEIVGVPSTHTKQPVWSKFYDAANAADPGLKPIVLFVHGAGYTQNTHSQFPYYFREQMFHNLLSERGYLVLDMDYRASEGYGRDWRTAIYRNMGHPELEDLIDGVDWLVKEHHGDPKNVGLYGGSYGGFMTLMALFRAPDVFKTGAALRPVTDWTQYNHEYTSNILNTPQDDDIAYRRSSPIEFAAGLKGPLLICHGMIDDNVFFQDSVRLLQRLIELHKDNVQLAPYPLERHGFVHADSWLDEYKRIYRQFDSHLK
jgi:dipeptidyl aminopeptidase/acylaminoacyl peptidase